MRRTKKIKTGQQPQVDPETIAIGMPIVTPQPIPVELPQPEYVPLKAPEPLKKGGYRVA